MMKYFKNKKTKQVYAYNSIEEADKYNNDFKNIYEITIEEARLTANPPLSQKEIDQKKEDKNIAFLYSEINRTETKLTQLYRLRDRSKASEIHLSQIEELEDYSTDLMLVEDQEGYPLHAVFPTCPDFFSE